MFISILIDVELATFDDRKVFSFFLWLNNQKKNVSMVSRSFRWCRWTVFCVEKKIIMTLLAEIPKYMMKITVYGRGIWFIEFFSPVHFPSKTLKYSKKNSFQWFFVTYIFVRREISRYSHIRQRRYDAAFLLTNNFKSSWYIGILKL